jgi:hypothetical protein
MTTEKEKNSDIAMPERIFQRTVSILTNERITTVTSSSDQGGSSGGYFGGSMLFTNPQIVKNAHDAVSYLRTYLTGDLSALPETRSIDRDEMIGEKETARGVSIRTGRNGYIVEPHFNNGHGWIKSIGDEVVFTDLTDMLKFCMDHLEGKPGTAWWDWEGEKIWTK